MRWDRTISALIQSILVFKVVIGVRNLETLQLCQAQDVQHQLGLRTCLQLRHHLLQVCEIISDIICYLGFQF